jgi:pimeloyl-ACP methyl ester carboxylesterase
MSSPSKTVVFVHGAWMTPRCWDWFKPRFEAAGYKVHTPTWPEMDRSIEDLRNNPTPAFRRLTLGKIVDHHEKIIRALPEDPLIVGHSFGGLLTQLLLDRGVGSAGIAIDPGPIAFVFPGPVSLLAATPPLLRGPWGSYQLSRSGFSKGFANHSGLKEEEKQKLYDRLVVPVPSRVFFQAAFHIGNGVSTESRKQPLLLTAGELDRTVTPFMVRQTYAKQKKSAARTDIVEFPGQTHFLIGEPGHEKVADYLINWHAKT